ncbi:MAG: ribosome-associated translation inhibitor RaiA [Gammaproteobacteria bacterium]|nr:ribosome-associated translation inhibitor RaiA [Gammaproteobacteria bacterium]
MNIQITGRHIELTDALRDFIHHKFQKLERHFDHITHIHVVLDVEGTSQLVKAQVHLPGKEIVVKTEDADMYAAIDTMTDKLDRQILKHKEEMKSHSGCCSHRDRPMEEEENS